MAFVNTLLGPIHPEEMGITAIHEHLLWGLSGWEYDADSWPNIKKMFEKCYTELLDFKLMGGLTYVDCSGIGLGRDLDIYVKLAYATQVNIIACTGFGADETIEPHFRTKDMDYFEELFVREITQGMEHTGIKAGVIKIASGKKGLTALEKIIYKAAARAAKRTGAAVFTDGVLVAMKQIKTLSDEGLEPERIIVSNLDGDGCEDMERDKQLARAGVYVAYDHAGIEDWSDAASRMPDARRVAMILEMINAGFTKRILLSTSAKCCSMSWDEQSLHNVGHLLRYFVPGLTETGITEDVVSTILVDNPKRVLPIQ